MSCELPLSFSVKDLTRIWNGWVNSPPAHKALQFVCRRIDVQIQGLHLSLNYIAAWLKMMLCSWAAANPLKPQRPHNTNKVENMCHAAPAYNFYTLQTFIALSLLVIKTMTPFSCGYHQRHIVILPTCGCRLTVRKFTKMSSSQICSFSFFFLVFR